jgi:hypothetical protein
MTSLFCFANMAPGVGSLAVCINKELAPLYPEVPFGNGSPCFMTGLACIMFEVYPDDSGRMVPAPKTASR